MANKQASFWKYTGNHSSGKNQERKDPHNFGLDLISFVAYVGDGGEYQKPLIFEDTKSIQVKHGKNDGFGEVVTVSAPSEVWEKAKQSLENFHSTFGV